MDAVDRRRQEVQAKLRGMIREAVRTKLGLLNEADFKGNTVSKKGRTLTVSVIGGQISGSTSSNEPDEVVIGMDVYDAQNPDKQQLADRVAFWDAELLKETLRLGGFTYPAADAILASRPPSLYTMVVRFGTFDTATKESDESVRLVASFRFDSNVAPTDTTTTDTTTTDTTTTTAPTTPPAAATAPIGRATPGGEDVTTDPVASPQQASMSVQEKIRKGAQAIAGVEYDDQVMVPIDIDTVAAQNAMKDHVWVKNEERSTYKLDDWSKGDAYTYFALVNTKTSKPVAFVVASDPEDNNHFSTGRFIGPNSTKPNLREAFCILYRRATGEEHPSCVKKGGGTGKGSGAGAGTSAAGEAGATRLTTRDGTARMGGGDAMTGVFGIGLRPAEKLRKAGHKIITRSKVKAGFPTFPQGEEKVFLRSEKRPDSLAVVFNNPVGIVIDTKGNNPFINFGANKASTDIKLIRLGWNGDPRTFTLKSGKPGFEEVAKWIFGTQEEFDLSPDGVSFEDNALSTRKSAGKKTDSDASTDAAATAGVKPAANKGEAMEESRRRPSLMDLYRF